MIYVTWTGREYSLAAGKEEDKKKGPKKPFFFATKKPQIFI